MLILLLFLCVIGIVFNIEVPSSLSNTSGIWIFLLGSITCFFPYFLCKRVFRIGKRLSNNFLSLYYLSFFISLLFLKFCWAPYLLPNAPHWGFDPQRYYIYAIEVVNKGYYDGWVGSGFNGIVLFYAYIFKGVGYHPLIPLYINMLLGASSVLIFTDIFRDCSFSTKCKLFLLLLIPEFLYFNVMSSKDMVTQYGLAFIFYSFYKLYVEKRTSFLFMLLLSFTFVVLIRAPYALAALMAIILFLLFYSPKISLYSKVFIVGALSVVAFWAISYSAMLSTMDNTNEDWGGRLSMYASGGADAIVGGSRIAAILTPSNSLQAAVFGFIRSIIYLFPEAYYTFFSQPNLQHLGALTQLLTGLLNVLFIAVVIKYIRGCIKKRNKTMILLFLFLAVLMFEIGFSTPNFIHQRYRINYDVFYYTLIIMAYGEMGKDRFWRLTRKWGTFVLCFAFLYFVVTTINV